MLSSRRLLLFASVCVSVAGLCTEPAQARALSDSSGRAADTPAPSAAASYLSGRAEDARVAQIVYRLAKAGLPRCPVPEPATGLVLQHLLQFQRADRAGLIGELPLDRGPGVIAVVPGGPAALAGVRAGDILLSVNDIPVPREAGLSDPFNVQRARARADAVYDVLASATPLTVTLLRDGGIVTVHILPQSVCPSQVHLARSAQRNAYADGRHVFLTTGMLALLHNDDELAFVIAHEMAHNILGHATVMRSASVKKGLGRTFGQSGQIVRGTETAADALGAELMLDAGFDPVAGTAILTRLGGGDFGIALLATHEPASKRIAAVRAIAQARQSR